MTAARIRLTKGHLPGLYVAKDDQFFYAISRWDTGWLLQVAELTETAGVRHAVGQPWIDETTADLRGDAAAIAAAYGALGPAASYRQSEHGHKSRMSAAISAAYDALAAES